jgi:hypothetical protein
MKNAVPALYFRTKHEKDKAGQMNILRGFPDMAN